jgi:hypothetical protein
VVGNWVAGAGTRVGVVRCYAPYGSCSPNNPPLPFYWVYDSGAANAGTSPAQHQPATGAYPFGGEQCDIFLTGDWNNTGTSKAGVYRSGVCGNQAFEWVLDANGDHNPDVVFPLYGSPCDVPITGKW